MPAREVEFPTPENGRGNSHGFPGIPGIRAGLEDWKNNEELEPKKRGRAV